MSEEGLAVGGLAGVDSLEVGGDGLSDPAVAIRVVQPLDRHGSYLPR